MLCTAKTNGLDRWPRAGERIANGQLPVNCCDRKPISWAFQGAMLAFGIAMRYTNLGEKQ